MDVVDFAGDIAEAVGGSGDGEIVHFIVHDDAVSGTMNLAPKRVSIVAMHEIASPE